MRGVYILSLLSRLGSIDYSDSDAIPVSEACS